MALRSKDAHWKVRAKPQACLSPNPDCDLRDTVAFQQVIPKPQNVRRTNGASKPLCQGKKKGEEEKKKKKAPKTTRRTVCVMKSRNTTFVRRFNGVVSFAYGGASLCKDLGMKLQMRSTAFPTNQALKPSRKKEKKKKKVGSCRNVLVCRIPDTKGTQFI